MKKNLFKGNADFIFGIVIIIFGISGYMLADATIKHAGSAVMPKLILAFIAVMGLGISMTSIRDRAKGYEDATKVEVSDILGGILLPGSFLIGAYLLIDFLGFYIAEFVLIVALMYLQEKVTNGKIVFNPKRMGLVLVFATGAIIVMYLIFNLIFKLPTPKGIFGF